MTDIANDMPVPAERPPPRATGAVGWLRANLFSSVFNSILTLLVRRAVGRRRSRRSIRWALDRRDLAVRRTARPAAAAARAGRSSARSSASSCSAVLPERRAYGGRSLVVVDFPADDRRSPATAGSWGRRLVDLWAGGAASRVYLLMHGGVRRPEHGRDAAVERPAADPDPRRRRHGLRRFRWRSCWRSAGARGCRRCGRSASAISSWCAACR